MRATLTSTDTDLRANALKNEGFSFSASASRAASTGARHGPSIMPGGPKDAYERVRAILKQLRPRWRANPVSPGLGQARRDIT